MLTARQNDLLSLIDTSLRNDGIVPSYDEMKERMGLGSKSEVHRMISALERRGFISRTPRLARSIEVLKTPASLISARVDRDQALKFAQTLSVEDLEAILEQKKQSA